MATYILPTTADACSEFVSAREQIEAAGIAVLSGAYAEGVLSITTDADVPDDLRATLSLTVA